MAAAGAVAKAWPRRAPRKRYAAAIVAAMEDWCGSAMRWGVDDCAMAVAGIDRAVTGIDTAARFRGRYRTERGAERVLGRGGLPRALANAARRHGWKRIEPARARTGDRGIALIGPPRDDVEAYVTEQQTRLEPAYRARYHDAVVADRRLGARLTVLAARFVRARTRPAIVVFYGGHWIGRRDFGVTALPKGAARIAYGII